MTLRSAVLALAVLAASAAASPAQEKAAPAPDRYDDVVARNAWWREARFGMFIHFGAYAVPARGEWVQSNERLSVEQYRPYVESFRPGRLRRESVGPPRPRRRHEVRRDDRQAPRRLLPLRLRPHRLQDRPRASAGATSSREYLDAFRAEGLRVGLYYSLIDWHHPDYPNVGNHPMRGDAEYGKTPRQWDRYLAYMHGQVEELVTRYGRLDVLWLDYSFDDYRGAKWGADRLVAMVRRHQPGILLNNRLGVSTGVAGAARDLGPWGRLRDAGAGAPRAGTPRRPRPAGAVGDVPHPQQQLGLPRRRPRVEDRRSSWSTRWWRR